MIQDGARRGRHKVVFHPGVQHGVDSLLHHDKDQFGCVAGEDVEAGEQLRDFILLHHLQLTLGHAVPIHHDLLREGVVHLRPACWGIQMTDVFFYFFLKISRWTSNLQVEVTRCDLF